MDAKRAHGQGLLVPMLVPGLRMGACKVSGSGDDWTGVWDEFAVVCVSALSARPYQR